MDGWQRTGDIRESTPWLGAAAVAYSGIELPSSTRTKHASSGTRTVQGKLFRRTGTSTMDSKSAWSMTARVEAVHATNLHAR